MRMRWTFWILACAPALLWAQTTPTTVAVDWQPLGELLVPSTDRAAAEVLPRQRSQLAAETSARVAAVSVEVGQRVDADTLLVRLDGRDAELRVAATRAALQAAEASANLAQVRLDKARRLIENDYVSADEVKEREAILAGELATVAMRRSDLDLARRELSRAQLKAPFAGWVIERQAQVGQWVAPGSPLLTLVEDGPVEVSAQLDPVAASALRPDSHADYIDERGRRWPLRWLRSAPVIDPATRQVEARFGFVGEAAAAGSSGRLEWQAESRLPARYLVQRDGQLGIFLAEQGKARFVPLPGATNGRPARVDLPAQTAIVSSGQQSLNDGDTLIRRTLRQN